MAAADGDSLAGGLGCRRRCAGGCGHSQGFKTKGKDAFLSPLLHRPASQLLCRAPAGAMCLISSPEVSTSAPSAVSRARAGVTTWGWHLRWSCSGGTHREPGDGREGWRGQEQLLTWLQRCPQSPPRDGASRAGSGRWLTVTLSLRNTDLISCLEVFAPDSSPSAAAAGAGRLQRAFPSRARGATITAALR